MKYLKRFEEISDSDIKNLPTYAYWLIDIIDYEYFKIQLSKVCNSKFNTQEMLKKFKLYYDNQNYNDGLLYLIKNGGVYDIMPRNENTYNQYDHLSKYICLGNIELTPEEIEQYEITKDVNKYNL